METINPMSDEVPEGGSGSSSGEHKIVGGQVTVEQSPKSSVKMSLPGPSKSKIATKTSDGSFAAGGSKDGGRGGDENVSTKNTVILKIKRQREEEPLSALLVSYKRLKESDDKSEEVTVSYKHLGSGSESEGKKIPDAVIDELNSPVKTDRFAKYRNVDPLGNVRRLVAHVRKESRFKIVSSKRGSESVPVKNQLSQVCDSPAKNIEVVELMASDEKTAERTEVGDSEITCNGIIMGRELEDDVFDYYVAENPEDHVDFRAISAVNAAMWDFSEDEISSIEAVSSDDSNAEDYYANDYPDADRMESTDHPEGDWDQYEYGDDDADNEVSSYFRNLDM